MFRYLDVIVIACFFGILIQCNGLVASTGSSTPAPCILHKSGHELHVDCSRRNLTSVPYLHPLSTSVDLSHNDIAEILSPAFSGLSLLRQLDLSYNPLGYIDNDAFKGLKNLTKLYIRKCILLKQENLSLDLLLSDLVALREFSLTFNSSMYYPDNGTCLQYMNVYQKETTLSTVDVLEIDSVIFEAFQQRRLKSTKYMTRELMLFNGVFCIFVQFTKELFAIMPVLEKVSVFKDHLLSTDYLEDTFSLLGNLTELSFYNELNVFCYSAYTDIHYFFKNISTSVGVLPRLKTLRFDGICYLGSYELECHVDLSPLAISNSLETFVSFDNPFTFSDTIMCKLPISLRHFEFYFNCLRYTSLDFLFNENPQIETFTAPYQNNTSCQSGNSFNSAANFSSIKQGDKTKRALLGKTTVNLTTLIFTHSLYPLMFMEGIQFNSLKYLDLSWNQHNVQNSLVVPSYFSSERPHLEYLDLTGCQITNIEMSAFSNFTQLKFLNVSFNELEDMGCELSERLQHLTELVELRLDHNRIKCVQADVLANMNHLRILTLRGNLISSFMVDITRVTDLEVLDLSYNRISQVPNVIRQPLDQLAESRNISIDLTGNILLCNCDTLGFLQWVTVTKVHVRNRTEYICQFRNGSQSSLAQVGQIVSTFAIECASKTVLIVTASVAGAFFTAMIVTALIYRNRWKLRYLYYMAKLQVTKADGYEQICEYDAFVCYTSDDSDIARTQAMERLEVERELRLCIHERDFPPGHSIPMNICRCIHNSKRTLFFITRAFLSSRWCNCELRFAVEESLTTERNVILLVMLENIPSHELPVEFLDLIRKYTYLEYPRERSEAEVDLFWKRISDFISGI